MYVEDQCLDLQLFFKCCRAAHQHCLWKFRFVLENALNYFPESFRGNAFFPKRHSFRAGGLLCWLLPFWAKLSFAGSLLPLKALEKLWQITFDFYWSIKRKTTAPSISQSSAEDFADAILNLRLPPLQKVLVPNPASPASDKVAKVVLLIKSLI